MSPKKPKEKNRCHATLDDYRDVYSGSSKVLAHLLENSTPTLDITVTRQPRLILTNLHHSRVPHILIHETYYYLRNRSLAALVLAGFSMKLLISVSVSLSHSSCHALFKSTSRSGSGFLKSVLTSRGPIHARSG